MKKRILASLASVLCALAVTTLSTASLFIWIYQPKIPKSLSK